MGVNFFSATRVKNFPVAICDFKSSVTDLKHQMEKTQSLSGQTSSHSTAETGKDVKSLFSKSTRKAKPSFVATVPPPPPPPAPRVENSQNENQDEGWEREFQKLDKLLSTYGLCIKRVDSDGSCLFSSFAVHFPGSTSGSLRVEAVDYMVTHPDDFAPFIDAEAYPRGFDDYCRRMRQSTTWGGQLEIQALSLARQVNVFIFQTDGKSTIKMVNFDESSAQCVTVSYHDGEHYNSVISLEDLSESLFTVGALESKLCVSEEVKTYFDNNAPKVVRTRRKGGLFN